MKRKFIIVLFIVLSSCSNLEYDKSNVENSKWIHLAIKNLKGRVNIRPFFFTLKVIFFKNAGFTNLGSSFRLHYGYDNVDFNWSFSDEFVSKRRL